MVWAVAVLEGGTKHSQNTGIVTTTGQYRQTAWLDGWVGEDQRGTALTFFFFLSFFFFLRSGSSSRFFFFFLGSESEGVSVAEQTERISGPERAPRHLVCLLMCV